MISTLNFTDGCDEAPLACDEELMAAKWMPMIANEKLRVGFIIYV